MILDGFKSHLPSLDHNTQGFRKAEVAVLAGSPGSGKSAFALNQILTAINGSKVKTSLISLEMTLDEIMARLVVQMTEDVPLKYILDPTKLQPSKWYGPKDELNRLNKEIQKVKAVLCICFQKKKIFLEVMESWGHKFQLVLV